MTEWNAITGWDFWILDWIQGHLRSGFGDVFFSLVTHLGDGGVFWILLALILICTKKYRRAGISMGIGLVCCLLVGNLALKPLVARIRPFDLNPGAPELLISPPGDFSFPSGHTMASFAGSTALCTHTRKAGIPALALAALIAFSRLYLYVHYPTDVLAGLALGVVFGLLAPVILRKIEPLLLRLRSHS